MVVKLAALTAEKWDEGLAGMLVEMLGEIAVAEKAEMMVGRRAAH